MSTPSSRRLNCYGTGRVFREGGGGVVSISVLCHVCHVFPHLLSLFGLFPDLAKCYHYYSGTIKHIYGLELLIFIAQTTNKYKYKLCFLRNIPKINKY